MTWPVHVTIILFIYFSTYECIIITHYFYSEIFMVACALYVMSYVEMFYAILVGGSLYETVTILQILV